MAKGARGGRKAQPQARRKPHAPRKAGDGGLKQQLAEARAQHEAVAGILKVMARSPADVQPVFDAIIGSAIRLLGGTTAHVTRLEDGQLHLVAFSKTDAAGAAALRKIYPLTVAGSAAADVLEQRQALVVADADKDARMSDAVRAATRARGVRSFIMVPMVRNGTSIGTIIVNRARAGAFSRHEAELLTTFADQAVIAIENVRLFNETKEALERQTATAEILKVIASSPADVQPVLEAVAVSAARLCEAKDVIVLLREGDALRYRVHHGDITPAVSMGDTKRISRDWSAGRCAVDGRQLHIHDILAAPDEFPDGARMGKQAGYRTVLMTPLLRDGEVLGVIGMRRTEVRPFEPRQIELINTFANQAVIAIENVRLFNETKESLERQTATAEILRVIASSPSDVQPVFDAIAASARRLLVGDAALVARRDGDMLHLAAYTSTNEGADAALRALWPSPITGRGHMGRAVLGAEPVWVDDIQNDASYSEAFRESARIRGVRSVVSVPMLREGEAIGVISVNRSVAGRFSEHQTNLLRTFADQAVIAIENVRLFNETKEALERQTATAEILRVIASSPSEVQPVLDAVAERAARICSAPYSDIILVDGGGIRVAAGYGDIARSPRDQILPLDRSTAMGRSIVDRQAIHIADLLAQGHEFPRGREMALQFGHRTLIAVPLLREGEALGTILVRRTEVRPFVDKEIAMLKTFADQAVIAIENVRLFKELQSRTEALTRSVGQLTALSEVGQAISSSLDIETVLQTIVSRAVQLTGVDAGSIYEYDEREEVYRLQAAEKMAPELVEAVRRTPIRKGDGATGRTAETLEPVQTPDIQDDSYHGSRKDNLLRMGYRAVLAVPLLREGRLLGALQVFRSAPGEFAPDVVELLKTFATQSAMAIQNARLFREIAEKGKQLEVASRHKSDFLASMSHELRTPLNAILGFNEMILGQIYGEVPKDMQEPLEDIQKSGKHLLRLINNVLDLAKIEAGRMELALSDYSVHDTVAAVHSTLRPLAAEKGLEFAVAVPADLPLAHGDSGRITQCLMNLAGNSVKFTKAGKVEIIVEASGDRLVYKVVDTGVGIPADKIGSLFTEFRQTDATIASEYGGTGLGLSISKKFVEMHGGRIWIESELGKGSAFIFEIPLRVNAA